MESSAVVTGGGLELGPPKWFDVEQFVAKLSSCRSELYEHPFSTQSLKVFSQSQSLTPLADRANRELEKRAARPQTPLLRRPRQPDSVSNLPLTIL